MVDRTRRFIGLLIGTTLLLAWSACLSAKTYVGIVQGLAGEDYYQRLFDKQVEVIKTVSEQVPGAVEYRLFAGDEARKEKVLTWLSTTAETSTSSDRFVFYYVGHGSYDESEYKFNLPGADLTGDEIKLAVDAIDAELKLLVNTSSSSGALLELFEADSDIHLVTATRSGGERNATRFGRFFAEALQDESADLDKNGLISAQEAFEFAERQTEDFYTSEGLIATEHSVLKGEHANLFALASIIDRPGLVEGDPELSKLYQERDEIDLQIERLRMRRIGMNADDYRQDFQRLLIQLSLLQVKIDELEEGDP